MKLFVIYTSLQECACSLLAVGCFKLWIKADSVSCPAAAILLKCCFHLKTMKRLPVQFLKQKFRPAKMVSEVILWGRNF